MLPSLERRELLGTALNLIPGFHILTALPAQQASQTPEDKDYIDRLANTENWFAKHAEHCLKRISWQGSNSDWSEQLHQHLDRFEQAAVGADGGPGMWITRAQMDFLNWQTQISAEKAPCETRLLVATMFLIDMTLSCHDAFDQSGSTTFVEALKSKHPSLHAALVAALRALNIDEVLGMVDGCAEMENLQGCAQALTRDLLKALAPTIKEMIPSLIGSGD